MDTVEYAPDRLADVHGDPAQHTVLLWHGKQPDSRAALATLVAQLVDHDLGVVAPDWDSAAGDGGRADLLRSLRFARERVSDPDALTLVGWSLGGAAAAGVTIHARRLGIGFAHTVCLSGAFPAREPISGELLPTDLPGGDRRSPFTLLHGVADDVVPVSASRAFATTLMRNDWPVEVMELPTDHGGIAGAFYDVAADRYEASTDPEVVPVAAEVAATIAALVPPAGRDASR